MSSPVIRVWPYAGQGATKVAMTATKAATGASPPVLARVRCAELGSSGAYLRPAPARGGGGGGGLPEGIVRSSPRLVQPPLLLVHRHHRLARWSTRRDSASHGRLRTYARRPRHRHRPSDGVPQSCSKHTPLCSRGANGKSLCESVSWNNWVFGSGTMKGGRAPLAGRREGVDADLGADVRGCCGGAGVQADAGGVGYAGDAVEAGRH